MPTTPPCPSACPWPAPVTSVPTQAEALVFEFPEEAILLAFLADPSLRCAGCPPGLGMALYTWLTPHSPQPFSDDFLPACRLVGMQRICSHASMCFSGLFVGPLVPHPVTPPPCFHW